MAFSIWKSTCPKFPLMSFSVGFEKFRHLCKKAKVTYVEAMLSPDHCGACFFGLFK